MSGVNFSALQPLCVMALAFTPPPLLYLLPGAPRRLAARPQFMAALWRTAQNALATVWCRQSTALFFCPPRQNNKGRRTAKLLCGGLFVF